MMRYIIMCGGTYKKWQTPRQLTKINGEPIVARTIRLLRENGVESIAISSNDEIFEQFGVPVLRHENGYVANGNSDIQGRWYEAFYITDEPTCYLFGDVVFSPVAIRRIVEEETEDIDFFASKPPFAEEYKKQWAEPFALKVQEPWRLKDGIEKVKMYDKAGAFFRKPIMWELWACIIGGDPNAIEYDSYIGINDYTCDIDAPEDAALFKNIV